jgi:hypothetical protein
MSCFTGKVVCTNGTIPASDDAGGGLGWSIAEPKGGTGGTVALSGSIKFQLKGAVLGMRVGIAPGDYCYTLTDADVTAANGAGLTLKATAFKTECWGATGKAFADGSMAKGLQVALPGSASWTAAKAFDYCIVAIGPG